MEVLESSNQSTQKPVPIDTPMPLPRNTLVIYLTGISGCI